MGKFATQTPMHVSPFIKTTNRDARTDPIFFQIRLVKDMTSLEPIEEETEIKTPIESSATTMLIFVKQSNEQVFMPLICKPDNLLGFAMALSQKFQVDPGDIRDVYKITNQGDLIYV